MTLDVCAAVQCVGLSCTKTGQYLYSCLESHPQFEIAFVWNRSKHVLIDRHVAPSLILDKLENIFELEVDLIVEVAHPSITKKVTKSLSRVKF